MHRLALGALCPASPRGLCISESERLNAPFGARCFMTSYPTPINRKKGTVLMHRLALGAL